jgi:hypothetical protein
MASFQNSILINRPLEEVFAFLSNAENDLKWKSGAVEVKKTSIGPVGIDSTWRSIGHLLGHRIESKMECTEYEVDRKYTVKSQSAPFPFESRVTLGRVAGSTSVNMTSETALERFFNLGQPFLTSMIKRQFQNDLANLKDVMEAHAN